MHPLHDYIAQQLAEKLRRRRVVVWYDQRNELTAFVDELRGGPRVPGTAVPITIAGVPARLAEYDGSFFELRAAVEPHVSDDDTECVFLYISGAEWDHRNSVLMELEKAGECYEPRLRTFARNVLRQRYTDGAIDELLAPERVTYEDLARAASDTSGEPPSILKAIFHDTTGSDALLAAWLASDARDVEIEAKEAHGELAKLVRSRLGLELPEEGSLAKFRAVTLRYVLGGEFRADLQCPAPATLESVPAPRTKELTSAVRAMARRLRESFPDTYPAIADRIEKEFGFASANLPPTALGSIDTFRFEERLLLTECAALVADSRFDESFSLAREREHSFWLDCDVERKAQWEALRRMAELGQAAMAARSALARVSEDAAAMIVAYTSDDGSYRMDRAQRRMESWLATLENEPDELALGVVRRLYDDVCRAMADAFARALQRAGWAVPEVMHQTHVYRDLVANSPKPMAYFLVDAMRFEMGRELADRLPGDAEVSVRYAMTALPSITSVGMAALQPGAAASFAVVEQGGRLGARIDDAFLPDRATRARFAAGRIPQLVDLSLDELLALQASKLAKRVGDAQVVVVRSQEIDRVGEAGLPFHARQVMDTVIDNLVRAMKKLSAAGVEHAVVAADHGHLFFPADRDESMRIEAPGGAEVELHRRCWIGRGGTTPPGCVRVTASELGYASDLDFVFPRGIGVFRAGGDLAYHHGGLSLQETIVPVLSVRLAGRGSPARAASLITVSGLPDAVTNRIFTVSLLLGDENLALFPTATAAKPLLVSSGKEVGAVGMVTNAELDRVSGCVTLRPGIPVTVAFLLQDESVASLRVVVQDPATDAELFRSPADIPVRLGV